MVDGGSAQVVHLHDECGLCIVSFRRSYRLVFIAVEQDRIAEGIAEIGRHTVNHRSAVGIAHQIAAVDFLVGHIAVEVVNPIIIAHFGQHKRCSHARVVSVGHQSGSLQQVVD